MVVMATKHVWTEGLWGGLVLGLGHVVGQVLEEVAERFPGGGGRVGLGLAPPGLVHLWDVGKLGGRRGWCCFFEDLVDPGDVVLRGRVWIFGCHHVDG